MVKITGSPEGRGLGGMDGAGQAGMIRQQVASLGRIPEAIIIARYAPENVVSGTCTCPACNGLHPNFERREAIFTLANHLQSYVFTTDVPLQTRMGFVQRHFSTKKIPLQEICKINRKHINTITKQAQLVKRFFVGEPAMVDVNGKKERQILPGAEIRALNDIEQLLKNLEIIDAEV